jgi:hypothetical protein
MFVLITSFPTLMLLSSPPIGDGGIDTASSREWARPLLVTDVMADRRHAGWRRPSRL